jgi:hypothetical protein
VGRVSLMPDTFVEGGGLWDNRDVRFLSAKYVSEWNYGGKSTVKAPAFVASLQFLDDEEVVEQAWTCGSVKEYQASGDGVNASASGNFLVGGALKKSSNMGIFAYSVIDALPEEGKREAMEKLLGGNADAFVGMEAHIVRKKVERVGMEKTVRTDGKVYDQTVPVIDSILKFPWDKKLPPGAKAPAGKAAAEKPATAAAPSTEELTEKAVFQVSLVVGSNRDGILRNELSQKIFANMPKEPKLRTQIINIAFEKNFLTEYAEQGGWVYDEEADTISPAE